MASLRIEFIERANDHLDELDAAIRSAEHDSAGKFPDEYEFRRSVHSVKGSGGTFGFPLVTVIAQRLEDYMSEMGAAGEKALVEALGGASRSWPAFWPRESDRHSNAGWLGRQDSNLRMPIPKTGALPLGYAPFAPTFERENV